MNHRQSSLRVGTRALAATFAIAVAATLTGCFANPLDALEDKVSEGIAEGGAEKIVEEMTGGDMDIEFGEMPADFPSDVPIISDKVITSTSVDVGDGVNAMMVVVSDSRGLKEAADVVKSDFADWDEEMWREMAGEMYSGQFRSDTYRVNVSVMEDTDNEGASVVSYNVYSGIEE